MKDISIENLDAKKEVQTKFLNADLKIEKLARPLNIERNLDIYRNFQKF